MNSSTVFVGTLVLMTLITVLGCERARTEHQLERVKASYFTPSYYVITHNELSVGTYVRIATKKNKNMYEFQTTLSMPGANGLTLTTNTVYQFQSKRPYQLAAASRTTYTATNNRPYREEQIYPVAINDSNKPTDPLANEQYGLLEFFALELALVKDLASTHDKPTLVENPLIESSDPITWTVSSRGEQSITLSSSSGDQASYSFDNGLPFLDLLVDYHGLSMSRVSFEEFNTLTIHPPHVNEDIRIPVDRPIDNTSAISKLSLQFVFANGDLGPWNSQLDAHNILTISTPRANLSPSPLMWAPNKPDTRMSETLTTIVSDVLKGIDDPHQIVDELVAYVNRTITYREWNTLQSVEKTLTQRIGDCTEFAQLFTALATSADLIARTVVGIAYHDSSQTFGIHAWNEILFQDGSIRAVDPTWNQLQADVTHIQFPPAYQHEIVRTLTDLRIKVLKVEYDTLP